MREAAIWLSGILWLGTVAAGVAAWDRYENTVGAVGLGPSNAEPAAEQWRLIAFVHPRCPCFRPTLAELDEIHRAEPAMKLCIVFVRPEGAEANWERGISWDMAAALAGVEVACDENGAEAKRFGAATSGQVVLIRPDGRIAFRGGLTRGRGTPGDRNGRHVILDWMTLGSGPVETPVYGCPLFTPTE